MKNNPQSSGGSQSASLPLLLVATLLVGACLGIGLTLLNDEKTTTQTEPNQSQSTTKSKSSTESPAFKTFTDPDYRVSFEYPTALGEPEFTQFTSPDPLNLLKSNTVKFGEFGQNYQIFEIGSLETFDDELDPGSVYESDAKALKTIFTSKTADTLPLTLVPPNAGTYYYTTPQYIENTDQTFRGVYYYAYISNDVRADQVDGNYALNSLVILMSDGLDTFVQFTAGIDSTYATVNDHNFVPVDCSFIDRYQSNDTTPQKCALNENHQTALNQTYRTLLNTLSVK